jgi:hypothetical protein
MYITCSGVWLAAPFKDWNLPALYLKIYIVADTGQSTIRKTDRWMLSREKIDFIFRIVQNTQMKCVGNM